MLELSIANPEARIIEDGDTLWAVAGIDEEGCARLQKTREAGSEVEAELCRRYGDASIVKVRQTGGQALSITAWKGLTSCHEVFYRILPGAAIVISDHFRNILSTVPVADRGPSQAALCDHFLFRTVPVDNTFCESVKRLGRGEKLDIDPASGATTNTLFDRVENMVRPGSLTDYLDRVDAAMETAFLPYQSDTGAATLFSGGVDSTLLQTYLPPTVPPVCYELPHYTRSFEANYGPHAAALLGLELETHRVDPTQFRQQLESAIAVSAMPPPHLQLVYYQAMFALDYQHFIIGEQADAVFGIGMRMARVASYFASPLGEFALRLAAPFTVGAAAERVRLLRERAPRFREPIYSIDGLAGQFGVYTDQPLIENVFGRDFVRGRLEARMALMRERVDEAAPRGDTFLQHLEAAQMIDFLSEDIMMCFRHLAYAFGKTVFSPFIAKGVFESALSIPVGERYVRGMQGKYLPKYLLKRRLPEYPVDQRKGYTAVPFVDYYSSGALSDVWSHVEVPDLFQGEHRDRLVKHPSQMTWNAITLAIWQDKVGRNADLQPIAGSKTRTWTGQQRQASRSSSLREASTVGSEIVEEGPS